MKGGGIAGKCTPEKEEKLGRECWRKKRKNGEKRRNGCQQLLFIAEEAGRGRGPSQSVFLSLIQFQTNTSGLPPPETAGDLRVLRGQNDAVFFSGRLLLTILSL